MTSEDFAALMNARRIGRGKWQAYCPAHRDRLPSLSVAEGSDGRVLLHCFAGCPTDAILSALKLSRRDLFQGPTPSREQLAALETERKTIEHQTRERAANREAWDKVRRWQAVVNALGAKLARTPDDAPDGDALTRTFHSACEQLHKAEVDAITVSETRAAG